MSEYGGTSGMVQPPPHELTHVELARLERMTEPTDAAATAETVLAEKRASGEYKSVPE